MKKCGLLGEKLPHSYSPLIHSYFASINSAFPKYTYTLFEVPRDKLESFIKSSDYDCLNVTIPYKKDVIPYLDVLTPAAEEIGSVNTIWRENGRLYGDNTDTFGFSYTLKKYEVSPKGKKILILGNGGAAPAVRHALMSSGGADITIISRQGEDNYDNIARHSDAEIIVNTTPVGMFPKTDASPLKLDIFRKLEAVIDIIYNPRRTVLLSQAESMGLKTVNGLLMLVAQAAGSALRFGGYTPSDAEIENAMHIVEGECTPIVLVGMPGSGKSTAGRLLAEKTGRKFIDTDELVVKRVGMPIPEYFSKYGEARFRDEESAALAEALKISKSVIATGGGIILREENRRMIRTSSYTVQLIRPCEKLQTDGRPLSTGPERLVEMEKERTPLYAAVRDSYVNVSDLPAKTLSDLISACGFLKIKI